MHVIVFNNLERDSLSWSINKWKSDLALYSSTILIKQEEVLGKWRPDWLRRYFSFSILELSKVSFFSYNELNMLKNYLKILWNICRESIHNYHIQCLINCNKIHKTKYKSKQSNTDLQIDKGRIKSLGGVSIICWPVTRCLCRNGWKK